MQLHSFLLLPLVPSPHCWREEASLLVSSRARGREYLAARDDDGFVGSIAGRSLDARGGWRYRRWRCLVDDVSRW